MYLNKTLAYMYLSQAFFFPWKGQISYKVKITVFPSLLVIRQVKQSSAFLGITSWASIFNLRLMFIVMTLDFYVLNFLFQSFEVHKE